jgi:hypothetical protein
MNGAFSPSVVVVVVNDRLAASAVLVFLFNNGGSVGRLSLLNDSRVVPIPVVIAVAFSNAYASANRANAYPNTNIISEGGRGENRCGSQNQYELHQKSPPVI